MLFRLLLIYLMTEKVHLQLDLTQIRVQMNINVEENILIYFALIQKFVHTCEVKFFTPPKIKKNNAKTTDSILITIVLFK